MWRNERILALWRRITPFTTFAVLCVILLAIGRYVAAKWPLIKEQQWQVDWIWLLMSALAFLIFFAIVASAWQKIIVWNGTPISWFDGLWAWSRSSLARYLPTPIWLTASRLYLTTRLGVSWQVAVLSYGAELTGALAAAFGVASLALPLLVDISWMFSFVLALAIVLFVLPLVYSLVKRILESINLPLKCGLPSIMGWSCLYACAFLVYGLAHVLILDAMSTKVPPVNLVIGVSAFAWAIGTLNIFTPSGLGTRELVLIHGLQQCIAPPELLGLIILSRLATMFSELMLFALVYLVISHRQGIVVSGH